MSEKLYRVAFSIRDVNKLWQESLDLGKATDRWLTHHTLRVDGFHYSIKLNLEDLKEMAFQIYDIDKIRISTSCHFSEFHIYSPLVYTNSGDYMLGHFVKEIEKDEEANIV